MLCLFDFISNNKFLTFYLSQKKSLIYKKIYYLLDTFNSPLYISHFLLFFLYFVRVSTNRDYNMPNISYINLK